jgi:predicted dehydrogenase
MMCDVSENRVAHLKTLYPEVEGETNYNHMLNGVGLDAVIIATSVKSHFPMARASLLSGKHTFIENRWRPHPQECEELIEIARKKGLVLMVGHTFLYSPAVKKSRKSSGAATSEKSVTFAPGG